MTGPNITLGDVADALGCANENGAMLAAAQALREELTAAHRQNGDLQAANTRYMQRAREAEALLRVPLAPAPPKPWQPFDFEGRFWLELREPNKVPERKGSFRSADLAATLREFFKHRPSALISVVTIGADGPDFQDAPEALAFRDHRSRVTAIRNIEDRKAARYALGAMLADGLIAISAFRYALGRMSYVVGHVADWLIGHREQLSGSDRQLIVREIEEAAARSGLGMTCDQADWARVRAAMLDDAPASTAASTRQPEHGAGTRNELPGNDGRPAPAGRSARDAHHSDAGRLAATPRVEDPEAPQGGAL